MKAAITFLLCLLALTTFASAECAWVVWSYNTGANGAVQGYRPQHGAVTQPGCMAALAILRDQYKERNPRESEQVSFSCLPDTVDPRGTKGK
jgi:hypothetical protein